MMIHKLVGCLSLIGVLIFLPCVLQADPLDHWHWRNPLPQGNNLKGVAYVNNTFVAVGSGGAILTSPDGLAWTWRFSGTSNNLYGVTYGNNTFVAVGFHGTILTSADGVTWTPRNSGTATWLKAISYGNGTFVAVGADGTVATSADGVTWTPRNSGIGLKDLEGITYGNGTFVAVGENGYIVTSSNGVTWITRHSADVNYWDVTYGNGIFVAVGYSDRILTSYDNGVTWTPRTSGTDIDLDGVTYGKGVFVAVGRGGRILIFDGLTWTFALIRPTYKNLSRVTYGNGTFVAVGEEGAIFTSVDLGVWTPRMSGADDYLTGIAYGDGTFVAVGFDGAILTSQDDAVTWEERTSGTAKSLYGVTYGNNTFVAVGTYGTILTSIDDGVTWTSRVTGTTRHLNGITYGNGTFVAVGDYGEILTSADGVTWAPRTSGTDYSLDGIGYGNGTFVAVGFRTILTSQDGGVTWTERASGTNIGLNGVTYGNSAFVAVGYPDQNEILTSYDNGVTWTPRTLGIDRDLNAVTYAHDTFVAVGGYDGVILTSQDDGVTWTPRISGFFLNLNGVTYGNGTFVAVGFGGTILQSDSFAAPVSYTLTVTKAGTGSGKVTSNPTGINCGADCSEAYEQGTSVTLTPTPDAGSTFAGWTGDEDCSDGVVTMNAARTCTATFNLQSYRINLLYPSNNQEFRVCSYYSPPTFQWETEGSFKGIEVQFSLSQNDFSTPPIIKVAGKPSVNTLLMTSFTWKKVLLFPGKEGGAVYWRVVGTKIDKMKVESNVFSLQIGTPETVNINAPQNTAILDPAIPPTFDFATNCNSKFRLEISSLSDFSISTKIKAFNFTVSKPHLVPSLQKTLSAFQWTGVKKLVGTGTGHFRIKAWDVLSRPTVSEIRSFTIK